VPAAVVDVVGLGGRDPVRWWTLSACLVGLAGADVVAGPAATVVPPLATPDTPWPLTPGRPIGGFDRPVLVTHAGDGSGRLFVVEQSGLIRVVVDGRVAATPFADLRRVLGAVGGEQGLLGLAFHPRFKENHRLFVAYTGPGGANTVAELRARADGSVVDDSPPRVLLAIPDFAPNHNGGHVVFGPDGRLWVGTGDGGGGGDPRRTAQDDTSLLGKMLRLDVDAPDPGRAVDVWGKGLRNPWRYAFDGQSGDLWIADVGQHEWEEIHLVTASSSTSPAPAPIRNFGWSTMEGRVCFREATCDTRGLEQPVFVYGHGRDGGCSITGGVVVGGRFVFADYCSGRVQAIRRVDGGTRVTTAWASGRRVSSFGLGGDGTVWLVDHAGEIVPLRPPPPTPAPR
jgi:hypothetical protein